MLVKIDNILNSRAILQELNNTRLSLTAAVKVSKLIAESNLVIAAFDKERVELLNELAVKDPDVDGNFIFDEDGKNKDKFGESIKELIEVEVEFPDMKISKDDIGVFTMTPGSVESVSWFLDLE